MNNLIAVDIGNSSINIGYFFDSALLVQKISTHPLRSAAEYYRIMKAFLDQNLIEKTNFRGIISSVVASHTAVLKDAAEKLSGERTEEIVILNHLMDTGLNLKIRMPEKLGTDRLANAAGAYNLYNEPVTVVDFGTATTITAVGRNGELIGGSILPGIGLMNDVLAQGTSGLEKIIIECPGPALGKDTAGAIRSGLLYGTAGAVERILDEIEKETGYTFRTVITGGHVHLAEAVLKRPHDMNPYLTLEGLRLIFAKSRKMFN
jgi:type III pantothenate kinase